MNQDPVKLAYLRTSFVFAISVLITWAPSSVNRVYNLIYPQRFSFALNVASAVVLPLQGVWNAVIYFSTSWSIIREEYAAFCRRRLSGDQGPAGAGDGPLDRNHHPGGQRVTGDDGSEVELTRMNT